MAQIYSGDTVITKADISAEVEYQLLNKDNKFIGLAN
jgi:hypothetical protein